MQDHVTPRRHCPARTAAVAPGRTAASSIACASASTTEGVIVEMQRDSCAAHGRELPELCARRLLQRHPVPSRHLELRDPGRRRRPGLRPPTQTPIPNEAATDSRTCAARSGSRAPAVRTRVDCQFYVNVADNADLDPLPTRWGFAVFGRVIEGMEVVDRIAHLPTETVASFGSDVPVARPMIRRAYVIETAGAATPPAAAAAGTRTESGGRGAVSSWFVSDLHLDPARLKSPPVSGGSSPVPRRAPSRSTCWVTCSRPGSATTIRNRPTAR